ncbi:hypothetical protein D0469_20150 [Peribacillus saganii]|uniref:DUF2088 domain-containing protein n=1 Tax=Peribacillus saganii TaxID=2303992 RepID=A0A372LAP5_9BACI|nr:hypothetical protein [Peribacillus saganii]RFU62788.1 hypothetical protein D0469_20150 [Peribacillus saganii]
MLEYPRFCKIQQNYPNHIVENLKDTIFSELDKVLERTKLPVGSSIAITAGSRGINQIAVILKFIVEKLSEEGFKPFLFSAKGSHGGGEAGGQKELLESLGVTEEFIGTTISCSAEVVCVGYTEEYLPGLPIYTAKEAAEADSVLIVNRIKPHTNFKGDFESGILKMLSVGMGRSKGAATVHKQGNDNLLASIKAIGKGALNRLNVIGAIAIVENAYDVTAKIEGIPADEIMNKEPELLKLAKKMMPSIPFSKLDLLIVQQIGKNFSGTGMDTNIIGRIRINGSPETNEPFIQYIAALSVSEESCGNAIGVGLADFTTRRLVNAIDYQKTYTNALTSGNVMRVAIPLITENDNDLFETVVKALKPENPAELRVMVIKNTLDLHEFWISEGLMSDADKNERLKIVSDLLPLTFDEYNNFNFQD